jgi:enoyl-CoA hydratase
MHDDAPILRETLADLAVAVLTLNRPRALNALSDAVMGALDEELTAIESDDSVRCVVLLGAGRAFAAGADVSGMAEDGTDERVTLGYLDRWERVRRFEKPLIAGVQGFCLGGGCELAQACDIVVAADDARFGLPEVGLGIIPGAGGTQRLTRAVGKFKAMKMVLLGDPVTAREAESMGLVSELVPDDEVLDRAIALAKKISYLPPLAVRQIKEVLLAGQDASLDTALMLERKSFQLLFASEDQKEGMRAFLEKRRPSYKGK